MVADAVLGTEVAFELGSTGGLGVDREGQIRVGCVGVSALAAVMVERRKWGLDWGCESLCAVLLSGLLAFAARVAGWVAGDCSMRSGFCGWG